MKKSSLTVLGGPLAGAHAPLPRDGAVTVGSSAACTLRLDTPTVSPVHARLVLENGRATAFATAATPLVHVNDNPLGAAGATLRNGDILWLGVPGEADVVMLQCLLASTPASVATPRAASAEPTPHIETQALSAHPPPAPTPPMPPARRTGHEPTIALDPAQLLAPEAAIAASPPPEEPLEMVFDSPVVDQAVVVGEPELIAADVLPPAVPDDAKETVALEEDELLTDLTPTFPVSVAAPPAPPPAPPLVPQAAQVPSAPHGSALPSSASPLPAQSPGPLASRRPPLPPAARATAVRPTTAPRELPEEEDQVDDDDDTAPPLSPVLLAAVGFVGALLVVALGWAVWRYVL